MAAIDYCSVTIADGSSLVKMEKVIGLDVTYGRVPNGGYITRSWFGTGGKTTRFQKKTITVSGQDVLPPELRDLDYSKELTVTVVTGFGTEVFLCIAEPGATETWAMKAGRVSWSLPMEEV